MLNGNGTRYALDFILRPLTTAALALIVVGVSAYQVIGGQMLSGPFVNWSGIIIGFYFGSHIAQAGADRRRALDESPANSLSSPRLTP